ncbi:MAG: hypothetical protein LBD81_00490 [Holosporaceae bacterium]|jgi:hypothetical protein|nr:hypothetical protein [Holosporaceae bacterium]
MAMDEKKRRKKGHEFFSKSYFRNRVKKGGGIFVWRFFEGNGREQEENSSDKQSGREEVRKDRR